MIVKNLLFGFFAVSILMLNSSYGQSVVRENDQTDYVVIEDPPEYKVPAEYNKVDGTFAPYDSNSGLAQTLSIGDLNFTKGTYTQKKFLGDIQPIYAGVSIQSLGDQNSLYVVVLDSIRYDNYSPIKNYDEAQTACKNLGQGFSLMNSKSLLALAMYGALEFVVSPLNFYYVVETKNSYFPTLEEIKNPSSDTVFLPDGPEVGGVAYWLSYGTNSYDIDRKLIGKDRIEFLDSDYNAPTFGFRSFIDFLKAKVKQHPNHSDSIYHAYAIEKLEELGLPAICQSGILYGGNDFL